MGNAVMDRKTKGGHGSHNKGRSSWIARGATGCNRNSVHGFRILVLLTRGSATWEVGFRMSGSWGGTAPPPY